METFLMSESSGGVPIDTSLAGRMDSSRIMVCAFVPLLDLRESSFLFLFLDMILLESVAPWILAMTAHSNRMDGTARVSLTDFSQLGASNHDVERRAKERPAPHTRKQVT